MPIRPKVEQLPEEVRAELEQRLIANAFSGYGDLAAWLTENGFEISRSSLHRWGERFEERVRAVKIASEQSRALVEASPDDAGTMNEALMRLAQEKMFTLLVDLQVDPDEIDVTKLFKTIAEMSKAVVNHKRYAAEAAERAREQLLAEQREKLKDVARTTGMSAATVDEIRRSILGIRT
ncbi:MAG TPA: DUF3486 family protein [Tahibacter sp.]|uniref:DUF3486 family protein n=1 Tax=Tahibacter sp. TaxID=2056211 RepID=UPI002BEA9408|nr:DUF3486 family protein [Tahibacter sp.]HSX60254.1 DUF3486 family protein [Tahibacter sp.]